MVEHPVCRKGNSKPESVSLMQAEKTDRGRSSILLWIAMQGWCSDSPQLFHSCSAGSNPARSTIVAERIIGIILYKEEH